MLGASALSLLLLLALLLRADDGSWRPGTDDDDIVRHRMRSGSPDLLSLRRCSLPVTACLPLHGDGDEDDIEKARTNSAGTVAPEEHAGGDELRQQQHAMKRRRRQQRRQSASSGAPTDRWIIIGSKWREWWWSGQPVSWSPIDMAIDRPASPLPPPSAFGLSAFSYTFDASSIVTDDSLDKIFGAKPIQMERY